MTVYGLQGDISKSLISINGRVIVHDSREELEFVFPNSQVVCLGRRPELSMGLREIPGLEEISLPVRREEFR